MKNNVNKTITKTRLYTHMGNKNEIHIKRKRKKMSRTSLKIGDEIFGARQKSIIPFFINFLRIQFLGEVVRNHQS